MLVLGVFLESVPGSTGRAALHGETKQLKTPIVFCEERGDENSNFASFIPPCCAGQWDPEDQEGFGVSGIQVCLSTDSQRPGAIG